MEREGEDEGGEWEMRKEGEDEGGEWLRKETNTPYRIKAMLVGSSPSFFPLQSRDMYKVGGRVEEEIG